MAFWNAPLDDPRHASNAVSAALAMRATLAQLNDAWREEARREGREPVAVNIGIGLNTGRCCVGNLGAEQKFNYSALGDAVNIASRLEGLSKAYGVDIVIGEEVVAQSPDFALIELDQVRVKGRLAPLRIFTVLGPPETRQEPWFQELAGRHATLIAAYRTQRWTEAQAALTACRAAAGGRLAGLYDLYERRISEYAALPPPADWDGVFVAATKSG
jgi:adenylate cyclase